MHSFVPQFVATLGGKKKRHWHLFHLYFPATFGAFALGNVIAWTANSLQDTQIPADLGDLGSAEAWVVSMFMIGAACVPWVAAVAFQLIGKKWTLIAVSVPFIAGWLLLLLAKNSAMLLVGRFFLILNHKLYFNRKFQVYHWILWWDVCARCPCLLLRNSRDQIPWDTGLHDAAHDWDWDPLYQCQLWDWLERWGCPCSR